MLSLAAPNLTGLNGVTLTLVLHYQLAERYGITIQDDWIEALERAHGVKL